MFFLPASRVDAAATVGAITEYGPRTISQDANVRVEAVARFTTNDGTIGPVTVSFLPAGAVVGVASTPELVYTDNFDLYYRTFITTSTGSANFNLRMSANGINADSGLITRTAGFTAFQLAGETCGNTGVGCAQIQLGSTAVTLACVRSMCVPPTTYRKIGTLCSRAEHDSQCSLENGQLTYTCGDSDWCVGATQNVACLNTSPTLNTWVMLGQVSEFQLDSSDRCDTGLVCSAEEGVCVNDFGQGAIPADKLGEAASDIRDQIRNIINIALGFLGVIGVIIVIYGGIVWMTAAGDDEKVGKAKKTIIAGVIGIIIIGIAWTIVSYVLNLAQQIS